MEDKKKVRELTEMQKLFLAAVVSEECQGNIRKAMKIAGYSDNTPSSVILNSLSEELAEVATKVISSNSVRASFALLDSMENSADPGIANKIKAAQQILDRAGVQKKSDDLSVKVPEGGVVILPAKEYLKNDNKE